MQAKYQIVEIREVTTPINGTLVTIYITVKIDYQQHFTYKNAFDRMKAMIDGGDRRMLTIQTHYTN